MMLLCTIADEWNDPRILISVVSLFIGLAGFLFGLFSHRWTRSESRLNALGEILHPFISTAQSLKRANNLRRQIEQLQTSFPNEDEAKEAAFRVKTMLDDYHKHIKDSETFFREAEAEWSTRSFRFPDGIAKSIGEMKKALIEFGRVVNAGMFSDADHQENEFRNQYKKVTSIARGMRLAAPLEWLWRRNNADEQLPEKGEFDLTKKEIQEVLDLVHKRGTTQAQNTFAIHPPKVLLENPEIAASDDVVDRLKDSVFSVVFQDGTAKILSFPQLMVFMDNLIAFQHHQNEVRSMIEAARPSSPVTFTLNFRVAMEELMRPNVVKVLLSKIEFAKTSAD